MSEIVCQVGNQAGRVEFIWSSRGAYFKPYVVEGRPLDLLRRNAEKTRIELESLIRSLRKVENATPLELSLALAEAGFDLFNALLPREDPTAKKVRQWLENVRKESELVGLEIVFDDQSADTKNFLSVPWNLVYDEEPDKHQDEFDKGEGTERWRPFWAIRYNLTSARRVEPLKRLSNWSNPRVVVVLDPTVLQELIPEQREQLQEFLADYGLKPVNSMGDLKATLKEGLPQLLYWMGHATPDYLLLGKKQIAPDDLRNLLRSFDDRERPEGMLTFLNACQTGEAGSGGSFLDVLHSFGFSGVIATEQLTIDIYANKFGLSFLRGFLREGKPLGMLLHELRRDSAPMGLLYGAHCPPDIRVRLPGEPEIAPAPLPIRETGQVDGIVLGEPEKKKELPPPLPEEPYRSLSFYDEKDRVLFTGRDADVARFAATLDRTDTRILILHGESGVGKSSFLRAGVIPYLKTECIGYRFFRRESGEVVFVQTAKDLVGGLAQALLDATEAPMRVRSLDGESGEIELRSVLDQALGAPADYASLREALSRDPSLLAKILSDIAKELPYALVLVLDQAEEIFTLSRTLEEIASRDLGLKMIQRLVDIPADVKLIISLRTEYYGRLLDHLRAGRRDLTGVRDDLLRDFSPKALIEAIQRPTSETLTAPGQESPRQTYHFRYEDGIAEKIVEDVLALPTQNQDGVLPLIQVICTQLYQRIKPDREQDAVITRQDLDAIKGIEGGLKAFAEDALERSMHLALEDREAFKGLFMQLYNRQADGTLTTWMKRREDLECQWDRPRPFSEVLEAAKAVRLLREDELRIEGDRPQRYIRLGHDALARVAAAWKFEREEEQRLEEERNRRRKQFRRLSLGLMAMASLALAIAGVGIYIALQNQKLHDANTFAWEGWTAALDAKKAALDAKAVAQVAEKKAKDEADHARASEANARRQGRLAQLRTMRMTFVQIEGSWRSDPEAGMALLLDPANFPSREDRDFTWGYYFLHCNPARIFKLEKESIQSMAFSPDGKTLALAGRDSMIRLWDVASHQVTATLRGHGGIVSTVRFSPDGKTLASAGSESTIRLWDVASRQATATLEEGHEGYVSSLSFSPDGKTLASAGLDSTIRLWDVASQQATAILKEHMGNVSSVSFSPDGKTLASAGSESTIRLWDVASRQATATLEGNEGFVYSVSFSPDGKTLASAGSDSTARLWDVTSRQATATFKGTEGPATHVSFSPDGKTLASVDNGSTIRLWDVASRQATASLNGHGVVFGSVSFSPDGKTLASEDSDRTIRLWDMTSVEARATFKGSDGYVSSMSFSPDGKTLASAGSDSTIRLWDVASRQAAATLEGKLSDVLSVAFSPDGKTLASAGSDSTIRLWDVASRQAAATLEGQLSRVLSVAFSPDGKTLASGGSDSTVRLWDVARREAMATFNGHRFFYTPAYGSVSFSPDGKMLASADSDGLVRLWDVARREATDTLRGHKNTVNSVSFSSDGKILASAGRDSMIRLWDVASRKATATLKGDKENVYSVSFSPDGKTLASAGHESTIRLWDVASGEARATLKGDGEVRSVSFSPDGKTLASAGFDGMISLWNADFPDDVPTPGTSQAAK